jgi:hypothetical protein
VRDRIKSKWVYPRVAVEKEGQALIEFHIAKDGRLDYIALRHTNQGSAPLDPEAFRESAMRWMMPIGTDKG